MASFDLEVTKSFSAKPATPMQPTGATFSPVRTSIKNVNSTSSSPYLDALRVRTTASFDLQVAEPFSAEQATSMRPAGASFSPVRSSIKNVNSSSSSPYLDSLRGRTMASFDSKDTEPSSTQATKDIAAVSSIPMQPAGGSFSPVRSSIKNVNSSSSSPYLDSLRGRTMASLDLKVAKPSSKQATKDIPRIPATPMRPVGASFSSVRTSIKNVNSSSSSPYLNALRGRTMASYDFEATEPVRRDREPEKLERPAGASFSPVRSSIKNVNSSSSSPYLDSLRGSTMASYDLKVAEPFSTQATKDFAAVPSIPMRPAGGSFSPVRSSIKNVNSSSSSPYLDSLRGRTMASLDLKVAKPSSKQATKDIPRIPATPMRPVGASFSSVRTSIKNVNSSSSSPYLNALRGRTMASYDFEATEPVRRDREPEKLERPAGASFSPVRSSIKNVNSTSSSPYLDALRGSTIASFNLIVTEPARANPVPATQVRPAGASFSPVRSVIRNVDSTSSTPYLQGLRGHSMSSFGSNVAEFTPVPGAPRQEAAGVDPVPEKLERPAGSFSLVRSSIKNADSISSSTCLDALRGRTMPAFDSKVVERSSIEATKDFSLVTESRRRPAGASFSPVRSSIKNVDSTSSSPYLVALRSRGMAVPTCDNTEVAATDKLSEETATRSLGLRPSQVHLDSNSSRSYSSETINHSKTEPETTEIGKLRGSGGPPQLSFFPVRRTIKNMDSTSSGPYLSALRGIFMTAINYKAEAIAADRILSSVVPSKHPVARTSPNSRNYIAQESIATASNDKSNTQMELSAISEKHFGASFSPVRPAIKNVDSTSSSPYLSELRGIRMEPSTLTEDVSLKADFLKPEQGTDAFENKLPTPDDRHTGASFSPVRRTVMAVESSSLNSYRSTLKGRTMQPFYSEDDVEILPEKRLPLSSEVTNAPQNTFQKRPFYPVDQTTVDVISTSSTSNVSDLERIPVQSVQSGTQEKEKTFSFGDYCVSFDPPKRSKTNSSDLEPVPQAGPYSVQRSTERATFISSNAYLAYLESGTVQTSSRSDKEKQGGTNGEISQRGTSSKQMGDIQSWLKVARVQIRPAIEGPDKPDLKQHVKMMSSPSSSPYLDNLHSRARQEPSPPPPRGSTAANTTTPPSRRNGVGPDPADLKHKVHMASSSSNPYLDNLRHG